MRILVLGLCLSTAAAAVEVPSVSFVRDIVPILTKSGCAGSNCHGSIRGKNGFKLSLFGYDPDLDYAAITRADDGRRIDRDEPEKSLVLQKPTFQIAHGGGVRFEVESLEYAAILEWIREGASFDSPNSPRLESLRVKPQKITLVGIGSKAQLSAMAGYTDGSRRDVTRKVQYSANDASVIEIGRAGEITSLRAGETAIMVRTLGKAVVARIEVVDEPPMKDYPDIPRHNFIDEFAFSKLRRLNVIPSGLASDNEFLRRVYLDTVGVLPTLEETEEFLASNNPQKRSKLIDHLLERARVRRAVGHQVL